MGIQDIIRWILPREDRFYQIIERQAVMLNEASTILAQFTSGGPSPEDLLEKVGTIEHQGDELFHQLENALAQTFVTPIDREDIHRLSSRLDDVLDLAKTTAQTYVLYGVVNPSPPMTRQMELLVCATSTLKDVMPALRRHAYPEIIQASRAIFQFEKEGDSIFRAAVGALFQDPRIDAKELLREKDILEDLEAALNRCENVADVLSNLAVKHG